MSNNRVRIIEGNGYKKYSEERENKLKVDDTKKVVKIEGTPQNIAPTFQERGEEELNNLTTEQLITYFDNLRERDNE
jgi:hypothetical protein